MHGRVLRRNEKLKSCGVTDGCTIQVTSRMRGGGKHKDKKSKSEKKQTTNPERPEQKRDGESRSDEGPEMIPMEEALRRLEENERYQQIIECASEGSEGEVQQKVQNLAHIQKVSWMNKEQFEHLESGAWQAVEARRKGRDEEQEQRRQAEQGQEQSKQGKQVRFGEEQQLGKTEAENAGEPEVMGRTTEVRTGRGSAGLVRGGDERCRADETSRKGKGKGNGGKGEHEGKGGGFGHKGREEERVRMAPNMGAGGSQSKRREKGSEGARRRKRSCGEEETATQEKCVEAKKEANSMNEQKDVSKRSTWWIRVGAARWAAEQACDDDRVEETRSPAEEAEGETWGRRKGERQTRQRNANVLHVVFHFPTASTETATTTAAAAMRLQ